jgi:Fe-S-cluster-containing hydrogenase component 2
MQTSHLTFDSKDFIDPAPLISLRSGYWFKLICGASYQALPAVRNLTLAYALAGADCIDVAADPAVIAAAKSGLAAAEQVAAAVQHSYQRPSQRPYQRPWLMVSMSAGEDPHFRKAWFDPSLCPADCLRPCEKICPAAAIDTTGVICASCYGCGRCLPVCPLGLIEARSQPTALNAIAQQALTQADALEIHTQVGQLNDFKHLWQTLKPWMANLKLISISCPDGVGLSAYLRQLQDIVAVPAGPMSAGPMSAEPISAKPAVIWQTDGRPMSGDIGKGTTHSAIRLAQKVLSLDLNGYVQLAGGTNQYTVHKLDKLGLLHSRQGHSPSRSVGQAVARSVAGVAYGSFARHLLMPIIEQTLYLEEDPHALWKAVELAESLVGPLKQTVKSKSSAVWVDL